MRGTQGAPIIASTIQIILGFSGLWRNVLKLLSPLSAVPLVSLVGFGLYEIGFPEVAKCVQAGLPELLLLVVFSQYLPQVLHFGKDVFGRFGVLHYPYRVDLRILSHHRWCLQEFFTEDAGALPCWSFRSCCRSFLDKCPLSLSVGCSNIWWWRSFWNDDDFIHCSCRVNWHFRCFKICKRNCQGIGILLDSFFGIANGTSVSV